MRPELETSLHAFTSLISMENPGCRFNGQSRTCSIGKETGWAPQQYLQVHAQMLQYILQNLNTSDYIEKRFFKFVKQQFNITNQLLKFQHTSTEDHAAIIKHGLRRIGSVLYYPFGTSDHQIYLKITHTDVGKYQIVFFDLGYGRSGEPVRENYCPIVRTFNKTCDFHRFVASILVASQEQPSSIELYSQLYGDRDICRSCVPARRQTTGNCVVKNLIAMMKQDAMDFSRKHGKTFFKSLYLMLVKTSLNFANHFAAPIFNDGLPALSEVCSHIQGSQIAFTSVDCHTIEGYIGDLYNKLNAKVSINGFRHSQSSLLMWQHPRQAPEEKHNLHANDTARGFFHG